jgi:hypothetical protein
MRAAAAVIFAFALLLYLHCLPKHAHASLLIEARVQHAAYSARMHAAIYDVSHGLLTMLITHHHVTSSPIAHRENSQRVTRRQLVGGFISTKNHQFVLLCADVTIYLYALGTPRFWSMPRRTSIGFEIPNFDASDLI